VKIKEEKKCGFRYHSCRIQNWNFPVFFQIWESGGIQELNCTARRARGRVVQWHDASKNANIR
jgi:hypothetical protein